MKTIGDYMTSAPHTVGQEQSVRFAADLMLEQRFRHLPVLHGGKLVGVISDRDIQLVSSFDDLDPNEILIEEVMMPDPYTAAPSTPIVEAAKHMLEHSHGCVVVVEGDHVSGIFTTVDALRVITEGAG